MLESHFQRRAILAVCVFFIAAILLASCSHKDDSASGTSAAFKEFAKRKEAQAKALNPKQYRWPGEATLVFSEAEAGNWLAASNRFNQLSAKYASSFPSSPTATNRLQDFMVWFYRAASHVKLTPANYFPNLRGPQWAPVMEVAGLSEIAAAWNPELLEFFGTNIIQSIPSGSIYFGGTDAGRFVVSALCKDHEHGDPFFTLTQNALADAAYTDYLRQMYGKQIRIPTAADSQKAFSDYMQAAVQRKKEEKLKPGEKVSVASGGRVNVSGLTAVMEINSGLARTIFDANTNREFFVEESYAIDWMYPNLEPHGLILRLNREPLARLDEKVVATDRAFWDGVVGKFTGLRIDEKTSLEELADFAERIYVRKDLGEFKGDKRFANDIRAQEQFSKMRFAIADLYAWRAQHTTDEAGRKSMNREADAAFRQVFALCPHEPDLKHYQDWLESEHRSDEAKAFGLMMGKFQKPGAKEIVHYSY